MKKIYILLAVIATISCVAIATLKLNNTCQIDDEYKMVLIRSHIVGDVTIKDSDLETFDINKDGRVSVLDYVELKNQIQGGN